LDSFLSTQGIAHVDLIKIDVEGAEALVFAGARKLLARPDAPRIVCEVAEINQAYFGLTEKGLRKTLYDLGYRSFWVEDFKRIRFHNACSRFAQCALFENTCRQYSTPSLRVKE
jgi:hypothetical protein